MGAQGIGNDGRCLLLIDCHWNQDMPASVQVVEKENCGLEDQENFTLFQGSVATICFNCFLQ